MKKKICIICGKEFVPNSNCQKYCSRECAEVGKQEYCKTHLREANIRNKRWKKQHPEKVKVVRRRYREKHREEIKAYKREYYKKHREEVDASNQKYAKQHIEEVKKIGQKYRRTSKGKKAIRRHNSKHRQLGFNPLNKPFDGCEAHHINFNDVVYIPKGVHRSIWHSIWSGKNTGKINQLAFQFLLGNYIVFRDNKKS